MRLLVITPGLPLALPPDVRGRRGADGRGGDVTVATGRSLRDHVQADGLDWRPLRMSRGSNAGIAGDGSPDDDLRPFFAATRHGMVATLR